ncbi:MAG TPA: cell division protein FtsZ [Anaerolineaceae bacterium]|nr:cell division protein FtsZ [Anaerolineaceae bacterium]HPN51033.1 cell division protein FtsZ [Anaerolineaceae bacterium]
MNLTISSNPVQINEFNSHQPVIKVMGLGGGGSNAVNRMIEADIAGVDFITANTDQQALSLTLAPTKIQLGIRSTRGLGAGGTPSVGEAAAEESYREIAAALSGADMVFLTAGMGGGTGTGSIPIAARVARSLGAVTIAVVTTPFSFEGGRRSRNAQDGLAKLRRYTDTLITVPNDRLLEIAPRNLTLEQSFRLADDVLRQGIQGITEVVTQTGLINVDFAHVRRLMLMGGGAIMSMGYGTGENKARQAVESALHHPLLQNVCLQNAAGIIANFTGGNDFTFMEMTDALTYLQEQTGPTTEIIPGVINTENMAGRAQVILIVTGLGGLPIDETIRGAEQVISTPAQPVQQPQPVYQTVAAPVSQPIYEPAAPRPAAAHSSPLATLNRIVAAGQTSPSASIEITGSASNLDMPAFLRRRTR